MHHCIVITVGSKRQNGHIHIRIVVYTMLYTIQIYTRYCNCLVEWPTKLELLHSIGYVWCPCYARTLQRLFVASASPPPEIQDRRWHVIWNSDTLGVLPNSPNQKFILYFLLITTNDFLSVLLLCLQVLVKLHELWHKALSGLQQQILTMLISDLIEPCVKRSALIQHNKESKSSLSTRFEM